jgi:cellulose biosynthesis protein BcsQ
MSLDILNQKGEVGRTTLSILIAHELARRSSADEGLVINSDPQQSSLNWSKVREGKPLSRVTELVHFCIMASDKTAFDIEPEGKTASEVISLVDEILELEDRQ